MEPLHIFWFASAGRAARRLRHPRRLRSRRRHPAPVRAQGRGAARVHELDRAALGRQRGLAGRLWRSVVRGLSPRLCGGILRVLHAVHAVAVRADLSGVSMEFRSKQDWRAWRLFWDVAFFTASALAAFTLRRCGRQLHSRPAARRRWRFRRGGHAGRSAAALPAPGRVCSPWPPSPCTGQSISI